MGFYGKTQRRIKHAPDVAQYIIEPQRMMHIPFWYTDADKANDTDGSIVTSISAKLGSIISKHHLDMTVTPETVDPQNLYMAIVKLSWFDIMSPYVCGKQYGDGSYQDATPTITNVTSYLRIYPEDDVDSFTPIYSTGQLDIQERDLMQDKYVWHTLKNLRKVTVFNQQPLVSSRKMTVPSKCKRINPWTYYGMVILNDAPRGATPADTQVTVDIKQYFEEWQI